MAKISAISTGLSGGSLVLQITTKLRQAIFEGRYPPGSALRELRLAKELGVSQSTVREALQRLEAAGLVTRQPNIGTTVTRLSPREVRERVALRALLEVKAAQDASKRMGEPEFQELQRRLEALSQAISTDSYSDAVEADLEFHRYVWNCSGNDMLGRMLDQLTVPLMAFVSVVRASGLEHLPNVTAAHEPLIAALRSGDEARIQEAFTAGATGFYEDFMSITPSSRLARAFGILESSPSASE